MCPFEEETTVALVFELVVNAGPDRAVAARIGAMLTDLAPLPAGPHMVRWTSRSPSSRSRRVSPGCPTAATGPSS